jgi:hypothetical protein
MFGCETWSLTFSEESTIKVFENRVLRWIFVLKRDRVRRSEDNYITRSLIICTSDTILFGGLKSEIDCRGM